MNKITSRQQYILDLIRQSGQLSNREISTKIADLYGQLSRTTIVRDLNKLVKLNLIHQVGSGRNLVYKETVLNPLLKFVNVEQYFAQEQDQRSPKSIKFNFDMLESIGDLFDKSELSKLNKLNRIYQKNISKLSHQNYQKELERWLIELSWKSSSIEGNTYSLIDTEILLKEKKEAKGHTRDEAIMLLNHKYALEYIIENKLKFSILKLSQIENVHKMLVQNLPIKTGLRQKIVRIIGTNYKPLDNKYQIEEVIKSAISKINKLNDPFSKVALTILYVSYIQPFEDGNKRTSRLIGNAVMMANDLCPMSLRTIDEAEYKKAMILFYEQNSARYFKELFVKQFEFAVNNYFGS